MFRKLRRLGFEIVRQRGSHTFWRHPDGRSIVVPVHKGEDIGRGLLRSILNDIEIDVAEFVEL
ncbi:MAG: type II toxin-antitoxin system HicA family toxin [Endomicrobiia bacterium]|nr:type II toxin-antitoxin system HicA family toxin [Endomicrobiia bacterium]